MTEAHPHEDEGLGEPGLKLYRQALLDGRLRAGDAASAPCLVDLSLVHSTVVLHRLLRASEDNVRRPRTTRRSA